MRPISVLNLIILGSCIAITVCLIAVWGILFLTSQDPSLAPRVLTELSLIPTHVALFIPLTAISAMSFLASQKRGDYWVFWQASMYLSLVLVGLYYLKVA